MATADHEYSLRVAKAALRANRVVMEMRQREEVIVVEKECGDNDDVVVVWLRACASSTRQRWPIDIDMDGQFRLQKLDDGSDLYRIVASHHHLIYSIARRRSLGILR